MRDKDDGGPAFPVSEQIDRHGDTYMCAALGMNLRDYFAAKSIDMATHAEKYSPTGSKGEQTYKGIAERCYLLADAMIEARKK